MRQPGTARLMLEIGAQPVGVLARSYSLAPQDFLADIALGIRVACRQAGVGKETDEVCLMPFGQVDRQRDARRIALVTVDLYENVPDCHVRHPFPGSGEPGKRSKRPRSSAPETRRPSVSNPAAALFPSVSSGDIGSTVLLFASEEGRRLARLDASKFSSRTQQAQFRANA